MLLERTTKHSRDVKAREVGDGKQCFSAEVHQHMRNVMHRRMIMVSANCQKVWTGLCIVGCVLAFVQSNDGARCKAALQACTIFPVRRTHMVHLLPLMSLHEASRRLLLHQVTSAAHFLSRNTSRQPIIACGEGTVPVCAQHAMALA